MSKKKKSTKSSRKVKTKDKKSDAGKSEPERKNELRASHTREMIQEIKGGTSSNYFLFFLLFVVFIACYHIVEPYIHSIILAIILAVIFHPLHKKIEKLFRGRNNLAAFFSCTLLTIVVVLPLIFMLLAIIQQGIQSFNGINEWIAAGKYEKILENPTIANIIATAEGYLPNVQKMFPEFDFQNIKLGTILLETTKTIGKTFVNHGGHFVAVASSLIGKYFLMIFTFFFFIRDQDKIFKYVLHLIPLSSSQEERIFNKIKAVGKSALLGTIITALAQGAIGGLAFWIAGLPALFWGMVMAFASLIPMIGTALIWVPASGYLFISGQWGYGIFMVIWCIVVVGMIDNFVRPLFMQGSAGMSTLLIFFSILGGINYFGLIGLLYGPLIFGLATVLLYIYSMEFETFLNQQDLR